jgi:hypothetical protein
MKAGRRQPGILGAPRSSSGLRPYSRAGARRAQDSRRYGRTGSANATTLPPAGRPDLPPPAEMTTY